MLVKLSSGRKNARPNTNPSPSPDLPAAAVQRQPEQREADDRQPPPGGRRERGDTARAHRRRRQGSAVPRARAATAATACSRPGCAAAAVLAQPIDGAGRDTASAGRPGRCPRSGMPRRQRNAVARSGRRIDHPAEFESGRGDQRRITWRTPRSAPTSPSTGPANACLKCRLTSSTSTSVDPELDAVGDGAGHLGGSSLGAVTVAVRSVSA